MFAHYFFSLLILQVAVSPDARRLATVEFRDSMFKTVDNALMASSVLRSKQPDAHYELARGSDLMEVTPAFEEVKKDHRRGGRKKVMKAVQNDTLGCTGDSPALSTPNVYDDRIFESGRLYQMKFWDIEIYREISGSNKSELVTTVQSPHVHDVSAFVAVSTGVQDYGDVRTK